MTTETAEVSPDTRFVNQLLSLARRADDADSQARAALARIRRSVGGRELSYAALRDIGDFIPANAGGRIEIYILLAGLFALHPSEGGRGTLATSLRLLRESISGKESLDLRFNAQLNSDIEDLPYRLRQVVYMLAGSQIPICWHRLLRDLRNWENDDRRTQRQWARDYYTR